MAECKACLYKTDHPFGLTLIDGLCSGCITHKEKYSIDWDGKYQELKKIANWARDRSKTYDCVVPVVGDAEDYYVVSKVLELDLNPLIVSVNSYFLNDIGWSNLQNLITHFDLDSWIYNPEIHTYKELIRTSLRKYNHMYLPWLQLHTSFPVHVAKEKKIPLVVWGGNQSVEQVGKFSHHDKVEMSSWSRVEHDLFGNDIKSLIGNGSSVLERKLNFYRYPFVSDLGLNVRGIYLSNFFLWDPLKQNRSVVSFGFKPELNRFSYDPFDRAGSSIYYNIHDVLKLSRCGYRKVTDHLVRDLRHGYLTKMDAKEVLLRYSTAIPDIRPFFNWLGLSQSGFEWFKKHRLSSIEENSRESGSFQEPWFHDYTKVDTYEKSESFIAFGKGIYV